MQTITIRTILKEESCGGSRAAATSKMESFVIIVNAFHPLTVITKRSILVVAAALDPPLESHDLQLLAPTVFAALK